MKLQQRVAFSIKDVFSRRTFGHVAVGGLAVILGTSSLLLSRSFQDAVSLFIDECFIKVRPFVGSVVVDNKAGVISSKDRDLLDDFILNRSNDVAGVTEMARMHYIEFVKGAKNDFDTTNISTIGLPLVDEFKIEQKVEASSNWKSPLQFLNQQIGWPKTSLQQIDPKPSAIESYPSRNYIFSPSMRVPFFSGSPNMWFRQEGGEPQLDREFGVLVNATVLSEHYNWTDEEVDQLSMGKLPEDENKRLPTEVYVEFPTIDVKEPKEDIRLGRTAVPVAGVFHINHPLYPHFILSPDVLGAYYYQQKERWDASYSTQFVRSDDGAPLVEFHEGMVAGPTTVEKFNTLPPKVELGKFNDLRKDGMEPWFRIILHLNDHCFRSNTTRRILKQELEKPTDLFVIEKENPEWLKYLNSVRNPKARTHGVIQMFDAARDSGLAAPVLNREKTMVSVPEDDDNQLWEVEDESNGREYEIRQIENTFEVSQLSPWRVEIPDEEAGAALTRVDTIVKRYSQLIQAIVLNLSLLSIILFGCAHYFRKRKDLGLLKACGLPGRKLGFIFISQVMMVTLVGFALGLAGAYGAAYFLEDPAQALVSQMNTTGFQLPDRLLTLSLPVIGTTFFQIFIVGLLGALGPAIVAMVSRPVNDLRAGV